MVFVGNVIVMKPNRYIQILESCDEEEGFSEVYTDDDSILYQTGINKEGIDKLKNECFDVSFL